jgi:hypothetical protein
VLLSSARESANSVKLRVSDDKSAPTIVPSKILVLLITPVPLRTLVRVRVEIAAESKVTGLAPLKVRVKLEELITVLASKVSESAKAVKSKVSADTSVEVIVPSKILVELITPVPFKTLVKVRVEILALSKTTAFAPLKDKVNELLEMTVLASRTKESEKSVKFRESAAMVLQPVQLVTFR